MRGEAVEARGAGQVDGRRPQHDRRQRRRTEDRRKQAIGEEESLHVQSVRSLDEEELPQPTDCVFSASRPSIANAGSARAKWLRRPITATSARTRKVGIRGFLAHTRKAHLCCCYYRHLYHVRPQGPGHEGVQDECLIRVALFLDIASI